MRDIARKGDLAVVVGCRGTSDGKPTQNGKIVHVLSDASMFEFYDGIIALGNVCECASGERRIIGNKRLLPIRNPDPDQSCITERERENV